MFNSSTNELNRKINRQREELSTLKQTADSVLQILDIKKSLEKLTTENEEIFSIVIHNGKPFIITVQLEYSSIYIGRLLNINFYGYIATFAPSLYKDNRLFSKVNYNTSGTKIESIYLTDNIGCIRNQGYGSLIMESFLSYVKRLHVKKVYGFLSSFDTKDPFDPQNGKLLHHFYKKFGFHILPDNRIELEIE